jgi:hypothetical protein
MLGIVMVIVVALDLLNENVLAVADLANILNFLLGKKITFLWVMVRFLRLRFTR